MSFVRSLIHTYVCPEVVHPPPISLMWPYDPNATPGERYNLNASFTNASDKFNEYQEKIIL